MLLLWLHVQATRANRARWDLKDPREKRENKDKRGQKDRRGPRENRDPGENQAQPFRAAEDRSTACCTGRTPARV